MNWIREHKKAITLLATCLSTGIMLIIAMILTHAAPFGNVSLAYNDANIQYFDFFNFFQNILHGNGSLLYSFNMGLGIGCLAFFAYYLASPFNLLLIFISQTDLVSFFDIITILKLVLASLTCAIFLLCRFKKYLGQDTKKYIFVMLLSISYALCQFCVAQAYNTMWVDGVYMLPLILLGVYQLVSGRSGWGLGLAVGLSILFNWYTAGFNCLFTIVWVVFEIALQYKKFDFKKFLKIILRYCGWMIVGVMMGCILFLPSVFTLLSGSHSTPGFALFFDPIFAGQIPSMVQGFTIATTSSYGAVSLYCGSVAIICCIACFLSKKIPCRTKIILGIMSGFLVLLFYWRPFCILYSFFENVGTSWYRYAYLGVITVVFMAAIFLLTIRKHTKEEVHAIGISGAILSVALIVLNYARTIYSFNLTYYTVIFIIVTAILLIGFLYVKSKKFRTVLLILLCCVLGCELIANTVRFFHKYSQHDTEEFQEYVEHTNQTVQDIKNNDSGLYRISQTNTRNVQQNGLTANYNEGAAFNYWPIASYTSATDENQLKLLARLGYPTYGSIASAVETSILPADSLLGVKYIMSAYPINGLELKQKDTVTHKKDVYQNPFALPLAFTYPQNSRQITDQDNPFIYQNQLYSQLSDSSIDIYKKLHYTKEVTQKDEGTYIATYTLDVPEYNVAIYGALPWKQESTNTKLHIDGQDDINYATWLSPDIFYIPSQQSDKQVRIQITTDQSPDTQFEHPQFYALDLNYFHSVTQQLQNHAAQIIEFTDGHIKVHVKDTKNQNLLLSVPYTDSWQVTKNGQIIDVSTFAEDLILIPVDEDDCTFELQYEVKGLKVGIILSCIGIGCVIIGIVLSKRRKTQAIKAA